MDAHIIVLKGQSTHFIEKKRRPRESWERIISIILGILKAHHELTSVLFLKVTGSTLKYDSSPKSQVVVSF